MKNYQLQLKMLREQQKLSTEAVASKMSFTPSTIVMLEDTDDIFSLKLPTASLKNYFRKYAESLNMPEKKIVRMLNRIDYLDYKRSLKGKLTSVDFLNRTIILVAIFIIGYNVNIIYQRQKVIIAKQNTIILSSPVIKENSTSTIKTDKKTQDNNLLKSDDLTINTLKNTPSTIAKVSMQDTTQASK